MAHEFLSDAWFDAVDALGSPPAGPGPFDGPVDMVVTRPDGAELEMHLAGGAVGRGLSDAPTTVTTTFDVAKALVVDGDQLVAMHAFMAGEVSVRGDVAKLQAMGTTLPSEEQRAYYSSIRELTEP